MQYLVPIVALFQGRVIDTPEQAMIETEYSTGGDVGHKIFMIGGVLFLIIESKLGMQDENALAQLFLMLLSAAEVNKSINIKGLRIHGLLTNLIEFKFYSYDPLTNRFYFDEYIVTNGQRTGAFTHMINVSNKIFGVILSAYTDGLRVNIAKRDREKCDNQTGQNTTTSSKPSELTGGGKNTSGRKSIDRWEAALALAERCRLKFEERHQEIEDRANIALGLLIRSVCSLPRASTFSGGDDDDDPSTRAELRALAHRISKETHARYLSKLKQ